MSARIPQLTLDLYSDSRLDFASFAPGNNAETVTALQAWSHGLGPRAVYLWGPTGSGKTHLLQAAVSDAAARGKRAMFLPMSAMAERGAEVFEGLEQLDMLALDDLETIAGHAAWEQALFNLYNLVMAAHGRLLWAAGRPAAGLFKLPDLASRLSASLVYQLHELDDADKARIIQARAQQRGLDLPEPVMAFILRRERRDLGALTALLDALDAASLRDARALTVPFVRSVMRDRAASGEPPTQ